MIPLPYTLICLSHNRQDRINLRSHLKWSMLHPWWSTGGIPGLGYRQTIPTSGQARDNSSIYCKISGTRDKSQRCRCRQCILRWPHHWKHDRTHGTAIRKYRCTSRSRIRVQIGKVDLRPTTSWRNMGQGHTYEILQLGLWKLNQGQRLYFYYSGNSFIKLIFVVDDMEDASNDD